MTIEEEAFMHKMISSNTFKITGDSEPWIYCSLLYCGDCIHSKQCPSSEVFEEFIKNHQEMLL